jgi:Na+/melibiose symporter-like transporter
MVITAPSIALALFPVPFFIAVVATIAYTNKKIRKSDYEKIAMKVNSKKLPSNEI